MKQLIKDLFTGKFGADLAEPSNNTPTKQDKKDAECWLYYEGAIGIADDVPSSLTDEQIIKCAEKMREIRAEQDERRSKKLEKVLKKLDKTDV